MKHEKHLVAFQEHLQNKSASPRTVETYSDQVRQFLAFLEAHYPRVHFIQGVDREVLTDYLTFLRARRGKTGRPLANRTIVVKIKAVRAFFSFLTREGHCPSRSDSRHGSAA